MRDGLVDGGKTTYVLEDGGWRALILDEYPNDEV